MIELIGVTKWFPTDFGRHYVFRDVNLKLPLDRSVGVIGPNGAGKSTFLRIIAGADTPNEGRVVRTGRISPPMGLTPSLQASLTGAENSRFACRIYGMDRHEMEEVVEKVGELAGIGKYYDMPVSTYSAGMKQRVAFSISMMLHYDYYLFDEIGAGGDRQFQEISKRMVQERLATSKFIITSHRVDELVELCEACVVIMNGELTYFDKIANGMAFYGEVYDLSEVNRKIERKAKRKERKAQIESGELPATKEERRAAKKELKKNMEAELRAGLKDAGSAPAGSGRLRERKMPEEAEVAASGAPPRGSGEFTPQTGALDRSVSAAPISRQQTPARQNLPMAPRIKLPPANTSSQADQRIAELRQKLAERAGQSAGPAPLGTAPERPAVTVPRGDPPERHDGQSSREPRQKRLEPPDAAAATRAQERAARKSARAMAMLLEVLGDGSGGGSPPEVSSLRRAASAQESAAKGSEKALAALEGLLQAVAESVAAPALSAPGMAPAAREVLRAERKEARRLRRRLAREESDQAQPKTGTSDR